MESIVLEGYLDFCGDYELVQESFISAISPQNIWSVIKKWVSVIIRAFTTIAYNFKRIQVSKLPKIKHDNLNMVYSHWKEVANSIDMKYFVNKKLTSLVFEDDQDITEKTTALSTKIEAITNSNEYSLAMSPSVKTKTSTLVKLSNKNEIVSTLIKITKNLNIINTSEDFFVSLNDEAVNSSTKTCIMDYIREIQICFNVGIDIMKEFWETAKSYDGNGDSVEELDTPIEVKIDPSRIRI